MNTIDKVLDLYHINDISDCRIDYETMIQIAKEFSVLQKEKMNLQQRNSKAIEYVKKHTIELVDVRFEKHNVMVDVDEYFNPQALLETLEGNGE